MVIKSGIEGLDKEVGNISPGLSLIIELSPGEIRNDIKKECISQNLKEGGSAVALLSRESPDDFLKGLEESGVDVALCTKEKRLFIIDWYTHKRKRVLGIEEGHGIVRSSRDILNVSISLNKALKKISENGPRVAYVDMINEAINSFGWEKTKDYIYDIMDKFEDYDFATFYFIDKKLEKNKFSSLYPYVDGVIDIYRKGERTLLDFESFSSRLEGKQNLELDIGEDRVKVRKSEGKDKKVLVRKNEKKDKKILSPAAPIKNISRKIFGRSNKDKLRRLKKSKTNGKVNGRTNGLTNGKVNGRTNGLTNGKVNGRTNGLTNGKVNGRTNGLTNGKVNGRTN
ncbi:MAG: hypothetical protein R6W73_06240, partial [Candidatus Saliniplasma sp.]